MQVQVYHNMSNMMFTLKNCISVSLLTCARSPTWLSESLNFQWTEKKYVIFSGKKNNTKNKPQNPQLSFLPCKQSKSRSLSNAKWLFFSFFSVRMGFGTDFGRIKATNEQNWCKNSYLKVKDPRLQYLNCITEEDVPDRFLLQQDNLPRSFSDPYPSWTTSTPFLCIVSLLKQAKVRYLSSSHILF